MNISNTVGVAGHCIRENPIWWVGESGAKMNLCPLRDNYYHFTDYLETELICIKKPRAHGICDLDNIVHPCSDQLGKLAQGGRITEGDA